MTPVNTTKTINLTLKYGPLGLVRAIGSRTGPNSMLVDTGRISLADNTEVEVLLAVRRGELLESHSLSARVCGSDEHGAHLLFSGPGISALIA